MINRTKENLWLARGEKAAARESDLNLLLCDNDTFTELFDNGTFTKMNLGDFKIDENLTALDDRLLQYYRETENCDNKYAAGKWREFKRWAYGYSTKEIQRAKQRVNARI